MGSPLSPRCRAVLLADPPRAFGEPRAQLDKPPRVALAVPTQVSMDSLKLEPVHVGRAEEQALELQCRRHPVRDRQIIV